jgi:hypothetical protein
MPPEPTPAQRLGSETAELGAGPRVITHVHCASSLSEACGNDKTSRQNRRTTRLARASEGNV